MKYIPFTDDDKLRVSSIDLVQYLQSRGERLERVGREFKLIYYDSSGKHDSITVSGNRWFDHKNRCGGGAVKLLREHFGLSYQEAMLELLGGRTSTLEHQPPKPIEQSKKEFKFPVANENMRRVFAYLAKQRFISPSVISHFAKAHKIYEDKEHHNAVFVGTDENGEPKQASLRSTITFGNAFRITAEGSDTKYSFSHFGSDGKLFVFEAPIDMLSYITLNPQDWQEHSYIAMNGVYENAVLTALKCHSNLDEIYLCTDNDEGGIEAVDRLKDILNKNGYEKIFRLAPRNKDFNEDLKELNGIAPLPAVPHRRKETYLAEAEQLEYTSVNPNRAADALRYAINRNDYTALAKTAMTISADILSQTNGKPRQDIFEALRQRLQKGYKPYTDRGKMFSKQDNLKKAAQTAILALRNYPATHEQMKSIAKSLYELTDCAMRCHTEQRLSEIREQKELPEQSEDCQAVMIMGG